MEALVKIQKLFRDAEIPVYKHEGDSGADLIASGTFVLNPGQTCLVGTGISISIPEGFEGQVRSRSGLALKNQICVLNSPGTIDSNYRGEIGVILINHSDKIFLVEKGMRIAQLVIAPVARAVFGLVTNLETTDRGSDGFGSSGLKG